MSMNEVSNRMNVCTDKHQIYKSVIAVAEITLCLLSGTIMSTEPTSDTPEHNMESPEPSSVRTTRRTVLKTPTKLPKATFYVSAPALESAEKKKYVLRNDDHLPALVPIGHLDEVIGECRTDDGLLYFARYQEGIAHKARRVVYAALT